MNGNDVWNENLGDELDFWRMVLSDPSPSGQVQRDRAQERAVWDEFRSRIADDVDPVRILDVGSGPLTTLGTVWPDHNVEVVAIDPLADEYNSVLDELGIVGPVRAIPMMGEELSRHLPVRHFHLAHAANSLDHSSDPAKTITEMVAVTVPGGTVCLLHHVNVGEMELYHGLHQWNLCPAGGADVRIWSRNSEVMLSALAPGATIEVVEEPGDLFRVWLTTQTSD